MVLKWTYDACMSEAKNYKTRIEFQKANGSAYASARKNGWLDDYTWFAPSSSAKKWTRESCRNEASKYDSMVKFRNNSPNAYNVAVKNGWVLDYNWLERGKRSNGYWTRERCYDEAKKYSLKADFEKGSNIAYQTARRNGWLDDYTWLESRFKPMGYWNQENCYNEAKKYRTRADFQKGSGSAYVSARKNGWLDDYTWFEEIKKPKGYWTRERCYVEAKKYHLRSAFQKDSFGAYKIALNKGWLDDYTWFEECKKGNNYWTRERCYDVAKRYKSYAGFRKHSKGAYGAACKNGWLDDYTWLEKRAVSDKPIYVVYRYYDEATNTVYVGLANNMKRRHREHCNGFSKHGERRFDVVYRFFHSINKAIPEPTILKDRLFANDAQEYEDHYIEQYKKDGFTVLNLAKAGSLGAGRKWTKKACYIEARRYETRSEFKRSNGSAYQSAMKNGWINDYVWLSKPKTVKGATKYTEDLCEQVAKNYKTMSAFRNANSRAYEVARRNGWLDNYTWLEISQKE